MSGSSQVNLDLPQLLPGGAGGGELTPGEVIDGRYRVERLLGVGGMASVYEAENVRISRRVAIKVLHPQLSKRDDIVAGLEREARASVLVASHHVADVYDLGELPSGQRYMVMELLVGETLGARMKARARIPLDELVPIAVQLLDGLQAVHEAGLIHRDLKPANVFLSATARGDFVKIIDLGVCKWRSPDSDAMAGTPAYMSPEQALGLVDARADIFALGVMLFRAASGRRPWEGTPSGDLDLRRREPAPLHDALPDDVSGIFGHIVRKALAGDPERRYQSAAELREALLGWQFERARVRNLLAEFLGQPAPSSAADRLTPIPPRVAGTSSNPPARAAPAIALFTSAPADVPEVSSGPKTERSALPIAVDVERSGASPEAVAAVRPVAASTSPVGRARIVTLIAVGLVVLGAVTSLAVCARSRGRTAAPVEVGTPP